MRSFIRRTTTLALLGALAVGSGLPAAAQSGQVQSLSQRQSILTELSNTGEAGTSRVFTQLKATGSGEVAVTLPQQSTRGLRNLEGFGKPDVNGDDVIWTLDASDDGFARSVADNTADLPVSVSVIYRLDGAEVSPSDLAGRTGQVEVEYTVRNLTAEPREIISFDAENNKFTETMDVAVPMVGSLSLTLPASFANIDAPGAVTVGDGRGNTVINYSLLLFAPLGAEEQTVTWSADAVDTAIPETSLQVLPVDDKSFNSLNATADAYKGAAESLSTLGNGALIINSNLLLLGSGASQLLDGLGQLADGAGALNDGLANTAAPGARQLSDGMSAARAGGGQLATGLGELALGATRLANGLGDARAGGAKLSNGLGDLAAGAGDLRGGTSDLAAGARTLDGKTGELAAGAGQVADGASGLLVGLETLRGSLNDPDALPKAIAGVTTLNNAVKSLIGAVGAPTTDGTLLNGMTRLSMGLSNPGCDPEATSGPTRCGMLQGIQRLTAGAAALDAGALKIAGGLSNPACDPEDPENPCGLRQGVAALEAGVADLRTGVAGATATLGAIDGTPLSGLDQMRLAGAIAALQGDVDAGFEGLLAGTEALKDGIDQLRDGIVDPGTEGTLRNGIAQIDGGLTLLTNAIGDVTEPETLLNGVQRVTTGLSNPAAFNPANAGFNPGCDPATAENGLAPCGVLQALQLISGGLSNPTCDPEDPRNPCGLLEGLGGALAAVNAGLGDRTTGTTTLIGGAAILAGGTAQVRDGAAQLRREGTGPLASGAAQLDAGAVRLLDGARAASAGSGDLVSGLGQLADGGGQLAAGAGTAASGSRDLASGLVQLDDGASQLANGLGDAADGSGQLAEGLESAEEGGGKVADGVGALQEGFEEQLIGGVSAGRQSASQDYEQVKAVIARGREGAAPYGIADGADATTVFQFDLAGVGTEEGPSTLLLVVLALAALGAAAGLGLALRQRLTA